MKIVVSKSDSNNRGLGFVNHYESNYSDFLFHSCKWESQQWVEAHQPAGEFPDPPLNGVTLQIVMYGNARAQIEYGGHSFIGTIATGNMGLSPADTQCNYIIDGIHEIACVHIPTPMIRLALERSSDSIDEFLEPLQQSTWRDDAIRDYAIRMYRAARTQNYSMDHDADHMLTVLMGMLAKCANRKMKPEERTYHLALTAKRNVIDYIEEHLADDCALFKLASIANLSPYHFARAFRADTGDAPHQFVLRRRLKRAQELLRFTRIPIAEVALSCGFTSQQRLNDVFAREIGTTPGQARRSSAHPNH
jgi:AraC family transcriptional regulator